MDKKTAPFQETVRMLIWVYQKELRYLYKYVNKNVTLF